MADAPQVVRRNFRQYDKSNGQAGIIFPTTPGWTFASSLTMVASTGWYGRGVPSRPMSIVSAAFIVTTAAGADDACSIGIYTGAGTQVATSGAVTGKLNALGTSVVPITATLQAGQVYYVGLTCGTLGGTAAIVSAAAFATFRNALLFGSTAPTAESGSSAQHPAPASLPVMAGNGTPPVIALRES